MKLRVLGCSGGIGGQALRTTALLVDHDILIDAGTGVGDLSLAELAAIDHVLLTHAHLDHIACLPLMINAVAGRRAGPLLVHAIQPVIDALRQHIFNWAIWPDFSALPSQENPYLKFEPLRAGQPLVLDGRRITPLPACHTVPAVGYHLDSGQGSLVFSGDSGPCAPFWQALGEIGNLRHLIVECAFPNQERRLAERSQHLYPAQLAALLPARLPDTCRLHLTHLHPRQIEATLAELSASLERYQPAPLQNNQVLTF